MSRVKDVFYPDRENAEIYDELFEDVYKDIYPSLKTLYHRIDRILKNHKKY